MCGNGVITISTDEYYDLVRSQVVLEIVEDLYRADRAYTVPDVLKAVNAPAAPVITAATEAKDA